MKHYSLSDFEAVLAISRRGSFRAAALDVGMSTTALSNAIARLEGRLGVRLFNRTTRSVSLTEAGHRFVDQIAPALESLDQALHTVRSQQNTPAGLLRINTFPTAGREILAPLVLACLERFPDISIDVVTEGNLIDIVDSGFDFGVRSADRVPADMIAIPLGPPRRYAVVGSSDYFRRRGLPRQPSDLLSHDCIRVRLPNGALFRWPFHVNGETVPMDVKGPLTLDEASLARLAVLASLGIGFFMASDVMEDIEAGHLTQVLQDCTPPLEPLCLYYPSRRNPPAAFKALVDIARELAHGSSQA